MTPIAIQTNGRNQSSDYHINRTVTLADAWARDRRPRAARRAPAVMGPGPRDPITIPYAGREGVAS